MFEHSECPECGSRDVLDASGVDTIQTVVAENIAGGSRPVHVVRLKCKRGHVWSPARARDPSPPAVRGVRRTDGETRDQVLKLLSSDEVARMSTEEGYPRLADGDEYIDLAAPDNGVRSVHGAMQLTAGKVLARKAVSAETWAKIAMRFGARFVTAR